MMRTSRVRVFLVMLVICAALALTPQTTSFPTGLNAMGDAGCTCHGSADSATTVSVDGLPESFAAGTSYELMISVENAEIAALEGGNQAGFRIFASAGTFAPGAGFEDLMYESDGGWTHNEAGNDMRMWNITWTAPDTDGQIVEFTVNGNAVDGNAVGDNDGNSGDAWNTFSSEVTGVSAMGGGAGSLIDQAEPYDVAIAAITFSTGLMALLLVFVFYRNDPEGFNINNFSEWLKGWLTTTDHKGVGTLYFVFSFLMLLIGGIFALLFRLQLSTAENDFMTQEQYNSFFTLHGTTMIFLAAMPMIGAFANWIVPLQIGAKDLAFPRVNAMAFWMLPFAAILLFGGVLTGEGADITWTMYAPYSSLTGDGVKVPSQGTTLFVAGMIMLGASSTLSGVNFIATIMSMRAPGVTWMKMPLFTWSIFISMAMLYISLPALIIGLAYLFLDRTIGTHFYDTTIGGDPLLWEHLFWYFGHPEVYVVIVPAFGIVSEVLATSARRSIFGYRSMVYALASIGVLGFVVWGHHMLTSGMDPTLRFLMMLTTMLVAIPTGVKIFNWLATLWGGSLVMKTHTLWALGFVVTFSIGGISGMFFPVAGLDTHFHDTYFVVAHFHYVLVGGTLFGLFAAIYYWFPKATGRKLSEQLGLLHFIIGFISYNATFWPMHELGIQGMPRRYHTYSLTEWSDPNTFITISAFIFGLSQLILFWNMVKSLRGGERVGNDPWGGWSLEWTTTSPPPTPSFDQIPTQGDANEHHDRGAGIVARLWGSNDSGEVEEVMGE